MVILLWKTEKVTNGYKSVKNGYKFVKYEKADTFFAICSQEENACKNIICQSLIFITPFIKFYAKNSWIW